MPRKILTAATIALFAFGIGTPAASADRAPDADGDILGDGPKGGITTPPSFGSLDTDMSKPIIDAITTTATSDDDMDELECTVDHYNRMNTDPQTWGYTACEVDDQGHWTYTWQELAPEFAFLAPLVVYSET